MSNETANTATNAEAGKWRAAYEAKLQDFAAETRKTSILIKALHEAGHRGDGLSKSRSCGRCIALREVGAVGP